MNKYCFFISFTLFALAGCNATETGVGLDDDTKQPKPPKGVAAIQSELSRNLAPSNEDADALAAGNRKFAFDLYAELAKDDGNLFYSPYSISTALAMLFAGAEGNTETEMRDSLRFELPEPDLHEAFNYVDLELDSRGEGAAGTGGGEFKLNVVNAAWTQNGVDFEMPYLDTLAVNYGAGLFGIDFQADPQAARETINGWVEDQTEGLIEDLFPPDAIRSNTVLALTNAVYFNAAWAEPFDAQNTKKEEFTTAGGEKKMVDMMNGFFRSRYGEGTDWQAVSFAYDANELSFVGVLPAEGKFDTVAASLDATLWDEIQSSLSTYEVTLGLPKFEYKSKFDLVPTMMSLGMNDAFSGAAADFSGIHATLNLVVQAVVHQGYVKVNEEGTEAAAATGVSVGETSAPPSATITFNRPFLFFIVDNPTGQILFVGRVTDPTAG